MVGTSTARSGTPLWARVPVISSILWVFIVSFPLLMGDPVIVPTGGVTEPHCKKVRKLFVDQLPRPTNVEVGECKLRRLTIEDVFGEIRNEQEVLK